MKAKLRSAVALILLDGAIAAYTQKLKELGLPVERIASVHGGTATIEQFESATASAR